jgi:hypothetical protein
MVKGENLVGLLPWDEKFRLGIFEHRPSPFSFFKHRTSESLKDCRTLL